MHGAPAVSYPVGRSSFYGTFLVGMLAAGACVLVTWIVVSDAPRLDHGLALLLWLTSVVVAWVSWRRSPTGMLTWDGQHWLWTGDGVSRPVALSVTLDLQNLLLMYLRSSDAPGLWVWLEQRTAPARWRPCRRAVFARQPAEPARDVDGLAP